MLANNRFLASTALLALASLGSSQDMSSGYRLSHPSARVYSIADGKPVEGIDVTVQSTSGNHVSTSDAYGWAVFPNLIITPDPGLGSSAIPQEVVVVSVSSPLYVPVQAERVLAEGTKTMNVALTPRAVGGTTAWVPAATGGSFSVPGLGTLTVPPGVLLQDAFLHISTVPAHGQSSAQFADQLVHQVWLGALDQGGNWVNAIPPYYAGITLSTAPTILPFAKGTVFAEHWVSHLIDDRFQVIGQQAMKTPIGRKAKIPVAAGSILVTRTWDQAVPAPPVQAPDARGSGDSQSSGSESECSTTPGVLTRELGSRIIRISGTPMRCGEYDTDASGSVMSGQTFTGTSSFKASVMSEVGASLKTVVGELGSKLGTKLEIDTSTGTSTSTVAEGSVGVHQGGSLNGGQCFNADLVIGVVMKNYSVWHIQREVCPDGSIERTQTYLGDFEVADGISTWWDNMAFDGSCPGCAGTNPVPPKVPGTPMF